MLATFNVNFGVPGDRETLDAIERTGADVVLLQETNEAWESAIRARYQTRYPYMHFVSPSERPAGGQGVLSRHPLRAIRTLRSPLGWFDAGVAVIDTPRGPVQTLNVHLRPPVSDTGSWLQGWFEAPAHHAREIESFFPALTPRIPTLIAGDFNEPEGRGAVRWLSTRGYGTALPQFAPTATTWRWTVGPVTLRERLDHVVYDARRFECLRASAMELGRSDHVPVVAAFRYHHRARDTGPEDARARPE